MIEYIGENRIAGQIGELLIIIAFISSILSCFFYWKGSNQIVEDSWRKIARKLFQLQSIAILTFIGILFFLIYSHDFEYYYVWRHSSSDLPMQYILSCFWEGQEGSTMLWLFWNVIIGNVLVYTSKHWETTVMSIFTSVQVFLLAMLLGIFLFDLQIGSNPFVLLRNHPDMLNLPFTSNPNYLEFVEGNSLNPLLQNYWMTIHPPTVFLGFSLSLIPFCYALGGLWKKKFTEWISPALPWTFLAVAILGLGLLMGGAWAYEALSFGGFWAWDPVENSSLVPWLVLVAAGHLLLINKNKAKSLFTAFALNLFAFLMVVYSTYLTKSGILGETSVHSFADGLPGQLIIFLLFYLFVSLFFLMKNGWQFLKKSEEDALWSREFWMFLGALVLLISAFQITLSTSIPVFNALFGSQLAPPADPIEHYNSWQLPLAVLISFMVGLSQFLKYKQTKFQYLLKQLSPSLIVSLFGTFAIAFHLEIRHLYINLLVFTSLFAFLANLDYLLRLLKGNIKKGGSALAHIGFALVILGSVLSAGNKEIISKNRTSVNIKFEEYENANNENAMLLKGDTVLMSPYYVTLVGRRVEDKFVYYDMDYLKVNENGKYVKQFSLAPYIQLNQSMGNVPEPPTKHFWDKDIFTHITYADLDQLDEESQNNYADADTIEVKIGDSIFVSNALIEVDSIIRELDRNELQLQEKDIAIGIALNVSNLEGESHQAKPVMVIRGNQIFSIADEIEPLGILFNFSGVNPDNEKFVIQVAEKNANKGDFVIMQALVFPYINVLWIGSIVMTLGTIISISNRIRQRKLKK